MTESDLQTLLSDLVAIPSVNRMGSETTPPASRRMVEYLERWLRERGIKAELQPVPGGEENLIARIGPSGGPAVIFDAHTDTVPAEGWEDRAFRPRVEGDRLYGRGACDTKGCMTAMLLALVRAHRNGNLPHQVIFVATADEEYRRTGVRAYLDGRLQTDLGEGGRVVLAVVGEPTQLRPVIACKGAARWEVTIPGQTAHSSRPNEGINAISRLGVFLQAVDAYNAAVASTRRHPLVDPPTFTPTMVRGGTAPNVVPSSCSVYFDLRTLPTEDPEVVLEEARSFLRERCPFPLEHGEPMLWKGSDLPADHPVVARVAASCRAAAGDDFAIPQGVNYGCHASDYSDAGVPPVVLGPGDIKYAHAVDECIDLDEVARAVEIYYDLMTRPV